MGLIINALEHVLLLVHQYLSYIIDIIVMTFCMTYLLCVSPLFAIIKIVNYQHVVELHGLLCNCFCKISK